MQAVARWEASTPDQLKVKLNVLEGREKEAGVS